MAIRHVLCGAAAFALMVATPAFAQLVPNTNSSGLYQSRMTLQGPGQNSALTVHRNAVNQPCLDYEAASKQQVVNPTLYDHIVSITNQCPTTIRLKLCYYKSDKCQDIEVGARARKDVIMGVAPNMQYFRYSYTEKF